MPILRKLPKQARSRERFEKILDHADAMIGESGYEALKMNDLAQRAGVNIASIYQFFPNSAAVARSLIERYLAVYREQLREQVSKLNEQNSEELLIGIIDHYFQFVQSHPAFAKLWNGVQGDPELKRLDIADSQENAKLIAKAMSEATGILQEHWETRCFLVCDMTGNLIRTLNTLHLKQAELLLAEFKVLVRSFLTTSTGYS